MVQRKIVVISVRFHLTGYKCKGNHILPDCINIICRSVFKFILDVVIDRIFSTIYRTDNESYMDLRWRVVKKRIL